MNISQLKEEFLKHFDYPASREPYDSYEGGFYSSMIIDTEDAVAEVLTDISDEERMAITGELNKISTGWVKKN